MNSSIIAIKKPFEFSDFLKGFGCKEITIRSLGDDAFSLEKIFDQQSNILSEKFEIGSLVYYPTDGWIVIIDPCLTIIFQDQNSKKLLKYSRDFQAEILVARAVSTSGSYGYQRFVNGEIESSFRLEDTIVEESIGDMLHAENTEFIDEDVIFDVFEKKNIISKEILLNPYSAQNLLEITFFGPKSLSEKALNILFDRYVNKMYDNHDDSVGSKIKSFIFWVFLFVAFILILTTTIWLLREGVRFVFS